MMCRPASPLLHTRLQPGSRLCEEGAVEQDGIFCVSENCRPHRRWPEQGEGTENRLCEEGAVESGGIFSMFGKRPFLSEMAGADAETERQIPGFLCMFRKLPFSSEMAGVG